MKYSAYCPAPIATDIQTGYDHFDGFIVLHGTDTLAYTSSALSFVIENLAKPIVVMGSQISVVEVRSDGLYNFVGALVAAGNLKVPEVCVYFNNKLMRGNRTVKVDNSAALIWPLSPRWPLESKSRI